MNTGLSWHATNAEEVLQSLETDRRKGLSSDEHARRLKVFGENVFENKERFRLLKLTWAQVANPLVFILIAAGIVTYFVGEETDTIVIALAVGINTIVGVFQEGRASRAFERLRSSVKKTAIVIREGKQSEVDAVTLVPGDIVVLRLGDQVPADLRLLSGRGLKVNEAVLTGEWLSVSKTTEIVPEESRVTERDNILFMGTLVEGGSGTGVVVATGEKTELGQIATLLQNGEQHLTPFQIGVKKLANVITIAVTAIILLIFGIGVFTGGSIIEMFVTAVAIAVAAVPEGLPIAVTVILAVGMTETLSRGGLIKKLIKAETLGSTTTILTDKTGTITKGEMHFAGVAAGADVTHHRTNSRSLKGMDHDLSSLQEFVVKTGMFTSNAFMEYLPDKDAAPVIKGGPTDRALLRAGANTNLSHEVFLQGEPRLDHMPFESERRCAISLHKTEFGNRLYITGALEFILENSTTMLNEDGSLSSLSDKQAILDFYEASTAVGMRVVATAYKDTELSEAPREDLSTLAELTFTGLIGFHDPVREDVKAAIKEAREAGLRPIMVTGDHAGTALAVAREAGIDAKQAITGEELEKMTPEEVKEAVMLHQVFARVLPSQKVTLVTALKELKEIVAMTGDGVNDAPALKKADIGIAVGSGTAVAKEAADLILLEDSFSVIVAAIEGGRVVLDNLRKVVSFLLATGFSEVVLITGAILAGLPLPVLPVQILWANIVGEGFLNFALAFEPREADVMRRTRAQLEPDKIINRQMRFLIFVIGIATSLILLGLYVYLTGAGYPIEEIRTVMFAGLSIDAIFFIFALKSLRRPLWRINPFSNHYLIIAFVLSAIFLIAGLTLPPFESLLETVTPSVKDIVLIVGLGLVDLVCIEIGKWYFISRKLA